MVTEKKKLIVFGDRTATEVHEAAQLACKDKYVAIDKVYFDRELLLKKQSKEISAPDCEVHFHVGIANVELKAEVIETCRQLGWSAASIIHPTAVISPTATIEPGVFVGPLSVISSNAKIEEHSIIHIHASIGHDSLIEACSSVLPGARISGKVRVGPRSLIGSSTFVAAGVSIGEDCMIDALTYVAHDIPAGHIRSLRHPISVPRVDLP